MSFLVQRIDKMVNNFSDIIKGAGNQVGKSEIMRGRGRILKHHAVMYILDGQGMFEDETTPPVPVRPGTFFYLYPGKWHDFDPAPDTVWTEYWVLFDGTEAQKRFASLIPEHPSIYQYGIDQSVVNAYESLYTIWIDRPPGHDAAVNYFLHHILFRFFTLVNGRMVLPKDSMTERTKAYMKKNVQSETLDMREMAKRENMSYEAFRKRFRKNTGFSPKQYLLMLKINTAKARLLQGRSSVKEIAFDLGFTDAYYFSRLFKNREGVSPKHFREQIYETS